jgi:uncharacterized protein YjbI with pentapeptide repeats
MSGEKSIPNSSPTCALASLQGMQLEGVNLAGADLRETIFSEANLSKANLNQANCHSADHRKANLSACTTNDEFTKMGCSQPQSLLKCTKS